MFASGPDGNRVVVVQEGSAQADVNALMSGTLTNLGYTVSPHWRQLKLP